MENWFRNALFATAAMNLLGAPIFVPPNEFARKMLGFPESDALYLWIFAAWIFGFGVCYFLTALYRRREKMFIAIGAIGKLSFFAVVLICAVSGKISFLAPLAAVGDLIFGALFVYWLLSSRADSII